MELSIGEKKTFYSMAAKINAKNNLGEYYCLDLLETPLIAKILNGLTLKIIIDDE